MLEVGSDGKQSRDKNRMLLQASCLVRLGNALLANGSSTFFVKAIYVDIEYHAFEYTLYQRASEPGDNTVLLFIIGWQMVLKSPIGRIFREAL